MIMLFGLVPWESGCWSITDICLLHSLSSSRIEYHFHWARMEIHEAFDNSEPAIEAICHRHTSVAIPM